MGYMKIDVTWVILNGLYEDIDNVYNLVSHVIK